MLLGIQSLTRNDDSLAFIFLKNREYKFVIRGGSQSVPRRIKQEAVGGFLDKELDVGPFFTFSSLKKLDGLTLNCPSMTSVSIR